MSVSTPSLPPLLCMKSGKTYSLYTYKNGWNSNRGFINGRNTLYEKWMEENIK